MNPPRRRVILLAPLPLEKVKGIKTGPHMHNTLPDDLTRRIAAFTEALQEPLLSTLEEALETFCQDLNPEKEVKVCEWIAERYVQETKDPKLSLEAKKKIFAKTLLESWVSPLGVISPPKQTN